MIVKPSPETPLSVLTLGYLALQAGFPPGVFNVLTTSLDNTPSLSEALCRHELVKKVTFTGSTRVGKLVAKICADGLKKVTLELGGNCPFLVFEDADLEQASNGISSTKPSYSYTSRITDSRSQHSWHSNGATQVKPASPPTASTSKNQSTTNSPPSCSTRQKASPWATAAIQKPPSAP